MFDKNYLEKVREEKEKWENLYESLKEREVYFLQIVPLIFVVFGVF